MKPHTKIANSIQPISSSMSHNTLRLSHRRYKRYLYRLNIYFLCIIIHAFFQHSTLALALPSPIPSALPNISNLISSQSYDAAITSLLPLYKLDPTNSEVQRYLIQALQGSVTCKLSARQDESVPPTMSLLLDSFGLTSLLIDLQLWDEASSSSETLMSLSSFSSSSQAGAKGLRERSLALSHRSSSATLSYCKSPEALEAYLSTLSSLRDSSLNAVRGGGVHSWCRRSRA